MICPTCFVSYSEGQAHEHDAPVVVTLPDSIVHSCDEGAHLACNINGAIELGGKPFTIGADITDYVDERGTTAWDRDEEDDDETTERDSENREAFARELATRYNAFPALLAALIDLEAAASATRDGNTYRLPANAPVLVAAREAIAKVPAR